MLFKYNCSLLGLENLKQHYFNCFLILQDQKNQQVITPWVSLANNGWTNDNITNLAWKPTSFQRLPPDTEKISNNSLSSSVKSTPQRPPCSSALNSSTARRLQTQCIPSKSSPSAALGNVIRWKSPRERKNWISSSQLLTVVIDYLPTINYI